MLLVVRVPDDRLTKTFELRTSLLGIITKTCCPLVDDGEMFGASLRQIISKTTKDMKQKNLNEGSPFGTEFASGTRR